MAMTFGDLRSEVLSWLDESAADTTDASYLNAQYALKQAHTLRCTSDPWKFMLWPRAESLTTVSQQSVYALHSEFLRPFSLRNTTRKCWLREVPARNIDADRIDALNDVDTDAFALWGRTPVAAQPTSASVVTIVSSSASDTTSAKAITVTGDTADGMTSETITPNGTTPVAGTTSFTAITGITKGAAWVGTMTATTNSGAVATLTLLPTEYGRSYQQLQLLYLPTAGETLQYRFYRKPKELSATNDLTDIPPPFERILVFDALLLMAAYDNRLDGGRGPLWNQMRNDLDSQMRATFLEGQSIAAEPRFIGGGNGTSRLNFPGIGVI